MSRFGGVTTLSSKNKVSTFGQVEEVLQGQDHQARPVEIPGPGKVMSFGVEDNEVNTLNSNKRTNENELKNKFPVNTTIAGETTVDQEEQPTRRLHPRNETAGQTRTLSIENEDTFQDIQMGVDDNFNLDGDVSPTLEKKIISS